MNPQPKKTMIAATTKYGQVAFTGKPKHENGVPCLNIIHASYVDEGAFTPACDITLYNEEQITALRDFCNLLLADKPTKTP
jgi:hypothetical protein